MNSAIRTALDALKTGKFWKELFLMTAGMMLVAAAIYYFLNPAKLIVGSVAGLAILIVEALAAAGIQMKISLIILLLNVILLVLAYILLGKEFGLKTVYTALIVGPLVDFWDWVYPVSNFLTEPGQTTVMNDIWMDLVCLVLLFSIAQALLFHINASTGGLDIVAKILNVYFRMDIGNAVSFSGYFICALGLFVNPLRTVILGLVATWLNGLAVDFFTAGLNRRKRVCIITARHEEIRKYIIEDLDRGCSLYEMTGGYSRQKNVEIQALLTQHEFGKVMDYMKEHKINAFVTAGNVTEIYGLWHDSSRRRHSLPEDHHTDSTPSEQ